MISERTYDQHPPDREFGPTVLIVDDEEHARDRLRLALGDVDAANSLHILHSTNIEDALHIIAGTTVHVVLLDKNLGPDESNPAHNGIDAIPDMLHVQPHLQILMVTGSNDIQDVVRAMRVGACGYITKETSTDLLITHINRAINVAILTLDKLRRDRNAEITQSALGGKSKVFQDILKQSHLLAESNRPVTLLGETGTGKTAVAKWINACRAKFLKQKDRPFFAINVSTLTATLIDSELFGHEKAAFTGATDTKQGLFELANNGTLFLDEIGELSLDIQAKLLTVIEEGTFKRVGGNKILRSSPKLIFATNRDLEKMVAAGTFREDLWMRINMFLVRMPTLAERKEDIPEIVQALLQKCCHDTGVFVGFEEIPQDFIDYLCNTPIEGNIRGIQNQIERLLVLSPRDRCGRPIFKKWRQVPGLLMKKSREPAEDATAALSVSDLMTRSTNVVGPNFPGLSVVIESLSNRILLEAMAMYSKNKEIAKALRIPESTTSILIKRFNTGKNGLPVQKAEPSVESGVLQ